MLDYVGWQLDANLFRSPLALLYNIVSSASREFDFLSTMDASYFYLPNSRARTSSTMLTRSGGSGSPCLVPHLSLKAFSFLPFSTFAVGFSYMPFTD